MATEVLTVISLRQGGGVEVSGEGNLQGHGSRHGDDVISLTRVRGGGAMAAVQRVDLHHHSTCLKKLMPLFGSGRSGGEGCAG